MLTLNASQRTAIALESKIVKWAFTITDKNSVVYTYASGSISGTSNDIILTNFSGITLHRNMAENTVVAPSEVSFTISNQDNVLTFTDFKGGKVLIDIYISDGTTDTKITSWLFRIKTAQPGYQDLDIVAVDFLQAYLEGHYPNTRYPQDIFPSNRTYSNTALCVPVPFGTAYVPLRDVFITDAGYIVLGDPALTYTITKIRSPRSEGSKIEWDSGSYSFTQSTKADADAVNWRVFQAIIADVNSDGTPDAHGCWLATGGNAQDPPVRFTRSDTATMTNPADVISFVLQDMGIPSANIDIAGTFATAKTVYTGLGLTFNGAFWYKQKREAVLAQLLTMCHSCLQVGEKIELHVLSKTSQKTITSAEVLRTVDQGEGTFTYQDIVNTDLSDSGYVAYQESGEAQDELIKVLVGIDGASTVVSNSVVACPFVQDSQNVKRIGTLHFQRLLGKEAQIGFTAKGTCLALQPDDVITINAGNYGGSYAVLVDSVKINKDLSCQFTCSKYSVVFDDWGDLSPGALSIPADTTVSSWKPVMSGPDSTATSGAVNNLLSGRLRIGSGSSYALIDPATPLRISIYATDVEVARLGNLNGFLGYVSALYGLAVGSSVDFIKIDPTNGVRISGQFVVGTTNKIWLNEGADGVLAIGGTTKAIAPFRVTAAGAVTATTATITGALTAGAGSSIDGVYIPQNEHIETGHVAADNITRSWSYYSSTDVVLDASDADTWVEIAVTSAFTPTASPLIIWHYCDFSVYDDDQIYGTMVGVKFRIKRGSTVLLTTSYSYFPGYDAIYANLDLDNHSLMWHDISPGTSSTTISIEVLYSILVDPIGADVALTITESALTVLERKR